jgi:thiol-disulfide isomerase/thioredoxin
MRILLVLSLGAAAGCSGRDPLTEAPPPRDLSASRVNWSPSLEEAQKSGKPLLVYFYAPGCHPCDDFDAELEEDEVVELLRDFACVRIDVSRGPVPIYKETGFSGHPAILLYSASGESLAEKDYGPPKRDLVRLLRQAGK